MVVISICRHSLTRKLNLANRIEKPMAPCVGELDSADLLSCINDQRIWHAYLHLVLDESAIRQGLDHVIRMDLAAGWWLARVLQFHRYGTVCGSYQTIRFSGNAKGV
jgi:hypothetical protein